MHPHRIKKQPCSRWLALYNKAKPHHRALVITAVGGGGKTTLLQYLYDHYRAAGLRTALTTSCKMVWQEDFLHEPADIEAAAAAGGCLIGKQVDPHHAGGVGETALAAWLPLFDVVLIEGDGAKMLPVKVPLSHEPIIYPFSDITLVVAGLSALHRPLQDKCFRWEEAMRLLQVPADTLISADILGRLLQQGYLQNPALLPHIQPEKAMVILNQCDSKDKLQAFLYLRNRLNVQVLATSASRQKGVTAWQNRWWLA